MTDQAPKLDYASPAPVDCKIRWYVGPDSTVVWVDAAPQDRVRHEAIAVLLFVVAGVALVAVAVYLALRPASFWTISRVAMAAAATAIVIPIYLFLAADAWQNGGVILRIEVRGDRITWTKRNLWGDRTAGWPVAVVSSIVVWQNVGLRIHRRRGIPLNAFAFHTTEDLHWAASVLRDAIAQQKS